MDKLIFHPLSSFYYYIINRLFKIFLQELIILQALGILRDLLIF
jgi:hypothetical protein